MKEHPSSNLDSYLQTKPWAEMTEEEQKDYPAKVADYLDSEDISWTDQPITTAETYMSDASE